MMRRFASIWLPTWPTDRWRRQNRPVAGPLALAARGQGGVRLAAVDAAAMEEGLSPGMTLADARALVPELFVAEADPAADLQALDQLVLWSHRYTPWAASDGSDGIMMEITGCAHLFGGEAALIEDGVRRLTRAGIAIEAAIADTPAAAWAWARFRPRGVASRILHSNDARRLLGALPVRALRLPDPLAEALARVGLRTIDDVLRTPRAPLVARYGEVVARRIDQLLGIAAEPIVPRSLPRAFSARCSFLEPITRREDFETASERLLIELCAELAAAGRGARQMALTFFRVDATAQRLEAGTSLPSHAPKHLLRLFHEKFDAIDPGFGVEAMVLDATSTDRFDAAQAGFGDPAEGIDIAELIDRLRTRAGPRSVRAFTAGDTHIPERASGFRHPDPGKQKSGDDTASLPRPVTLFDRPEPIDVEPLLAGGPPIRFRWRGRHYEVGKLEGPETIEPEWWREEGSPEGPRDYYRIESRDGRRLWIFRRAADARWFVHGLFA